MYRIFITKAQCFIKDEQKLRLMSIPRNQAGKSSYQIEQSSNT